MEVVRDIFDWILYWVTYEFHVLDFHFSMWELSLALAGCSIFGWVLYKIFSD